MTKEDIIEDILKYLNNDEKIQHMYGIDGYDSVIGFPQYWKIELTENIANNSGYETSYDTESFEEALLICDEIHRHKLVQSKLVCHQSQDDTVYHILLYWSHDAF